MVFPGEAKRLSRAGNAVVLICHCRLMRKLKQRSVPSQDSWRWRELVRREVPSLGMSLGRTTPLS